MSKRGRAMRHRITIERPIQIKGPSGQRKTVEWEPIGDLTGLPCNYDPTSAGESFRGRQVQANATAVFEIRLQPVPILTSYRLRYIDQGDKVFHIVGVRDHEGENEGGFKYQHIFVRSLEDGVD